MAKRRWNDPDTAIAELIAIHKKYWISATHEEFLKYRQENPDYEGGLPLTVWNLIGHMRWALSFMNKARAREHLHLPRDYFDALCDYVQQFPADTPHPGEVPTASN